MNWFIILFYPQGIKAVGPFKEEIEAFDGAIILQEKGLAYHFETYPTLESTTSEALKEYVRESKVKGLGDYIPGFGIPYTEEEEG